ncbi:MAG: YfhO family protein [Ignavibacteria bacterium]|jgi:hypothetical protein|nr:YfhO family protein [Ignavibacteria bacterium]
MSKSKSKNSYEKLVQGNASTKKTIIPEKYKTPLFILILALLVVIFFRDALFGGSFWGASDSINAACFKTYKEQPGEFPLWQPYIFSGMPGMAAMMESATRYWDLTIYVIYGVGNFFRSLFDSEAARMVFWYIVFGSGMFFLMRVHKQDRWISLFAAIAMTFCTGITIWVMIGHNAKPLTFMMAPYVFIMFELMKRKFSFLYAVLTVLVMHVMMEGGHVQMMFYIACAMFIYLILDIVNGLIKKTSIAPILRSTGIFVIATGLAFAMSADKYLSVLEYTPYSTRGSAPITATQSDDESAGSSSKDYEYATNWSFSPDEIIDFFVPSYHGFGKVTYSGPLTGGRETKIMTYWGQKPFEDAAPYMGGIVMFLALLGAIRFFTKNVFVQAMVITSLFALLLSFGYTFPIIFDFFFYHFPKFSSFRAPSMALVLMHFCIPVLAAYGLVALKQMRDEYGAYKALPSKEKRSLNIFFGAVGLFVVVGIIFAAVFQTSYIENVVASKTLQNYGEGVAQTLSTFIWDNTVSDWTVIGILSLIAAALSYIYVNRKMSNVSFISTIIILVIFDLWRVSYRPMDLVDKSVEKNPFPRTDIVNFIEQDKKATGEHFRVCDLSIQVTNAHAYFLIESVNGYHPAKLRTYQDMLDVCCGGSTSNVTHPFLWNLLNTKYIITPQQMGENPLFQSQHTGAFVYYNPTYCKRAFFVDSVKVAKPLEIINHLKEGDFNPKSLAYVEKDLAEKIEPSRSYVAELQAMYLQQNQGDTNVAIQDIKVEAPTANIVEYKNEYIKIETESKAQHLLVLSEMYYPVCWKAYIDGKETEIYKTNFALRSVVVPAGNHTVEFKYKSENFELGKTLSTSVNIFVILALIAGIVFENKKRKKLSETEKV